MYQNRPGAILTELQVLPPPSTTTTKATDTCKSYRVQLHAPECTLTHGSLAGNFYAGPPQKTPDYSLASAHLLSKGEKKWFLIQTSLFVSHSLWESPGAAWGKLTHISDVEHVGLFRTPGLGWPFKQNVCLLEKKKREEGELPPGGCMRLSARRGAARRLAGRREIPKVTS